MMSNLQDFKNTISSKKSKYGENLRIHKLLILLGSVYVIYLAGMFFVQEYLIFFPSQIVHFEVDENLANAEHFSLPINEEIDIDGYFFRVKDAKETIIFFHGNGGNLTSNLGRVEIFRSLNKNVVVFDYRGYGKSTGAIRNEDNVYEDGEIVYRYVLKKYNILPENIIFWGQGLGGAVAIEMAQRHEINKLVIESSFVSVREMMLPLFRYSIPPILVKYKFNNLSKVGNLSMPILIIHSNDDEMIPFENGEKLFAEIQGTKTMISVSGSHNGGFENNFFEKKEKIISFLMK